MSKPKSSELQREREVQRYLQSWQVAQGSPLTVATNVDNLALVELHRNDYVPQASTDKALTAFAQLGALRLNAKRALISLIDGTNQYVLAEATRSLSLEDGVPPSSAETSAARSKGMPYDGLWLGASIITRSDGLGEHTILNTCTARDPDGQSYTARGIIVPNMQLDKRFADRPYVRAEPGLRFLAGVPIVSRNGHMIGSYAVADESPRDGLTVEELHFMQGVAQVVMEHFEWGRDRVDRFKGERIVRGLAGFIEECAGTTEDDDDDVAPEHDEKKRRSPSKGRRPLRALSRGPGAPDGMPTSHEENKVAIPTASHLEVPAVKSPAPSPPPPPPQSSSVPSTTKLDCLTRMYQRAAEILRQSTLADGAVLFGAAVASHKTTSDANGTGRSPSGAKDSVEGGRSATSGSDGVSFDSSDSDTSPAGKPCKILAYSLANERARSDIERGSALTLGTLEKYFSLFPRGSTFSFAACGTNISSEDDSASDSGASKSGAGQNDKNSEDGTDGHHHRRPHRRRAARMDHRELLKKIPGAKTVVFVPLFDHAENRLAGGFFLWTSCTGRMMMMNNNSNNNASTDLSYLRAFANSIVAQVARLATRRNEAAKTTFIASMSHELRSPLHGILGAGEFLRDTSMDAYQAGLLASIDTCGRTLLDTINHILDYSKINRLGGGWRRYHARANDRGVVAKRNQLVRATSDSFESLSMTGVVDLATLVEEVVDAVTAGHSFKKGPSSRRVAETTSLEHQQVAVPVDDPAKGSEAPPPVSVLLDVCPKTATSSWLVKTQPGALRRIIVNLVGNALKYTPAGHIIVSLRGREVVASGGGAAKTEVLLRIVDTGVGISEAFLRERLFVPFSQEDSFQPGTGLGLSIVKQIVDSLGGSVEVRSTRGEGTEVEVRLRFARAVEMEQEQEQNGPPLAADEEEVYATGERTRGMRVVLVDGGAGAGVETEQGRMQDKILVQTCEHWFGMEVVRDTTKSGSAPSPSADVHMFTRPPSEKTLMAMSAISHGLPSRRKREAPIIVVCPDAEEAVRFSNNQRKAVEATGRIIEVIPQPFGPKKLARALKRGLDRADEAFSKPEKPDDTSHGLEGARGTEAGPPIALAASNADPVSLATETSPPSTPQDQIVPPAAQDETLPPPPTPPPKPKRTATCDKNKVHVLLVDDNKINLQLLVMFVKKCGFSYQEAENGQEALDKFIEAASSSSAPTQQPTATPPPDEGDDDDDVDDQGAESRSFDFVLMDISMPVMNGIESTRQIRAFERERDLAPTSVIALTGLASSDAQRDARYAGVDVYLPKPVKFAELRKLLIVK